MKTKLNNNEVNNNKIIRFINGKYLKQYYDILLVFIKEFKFFTSLIYLSLDM